MRCTQRYSWKTWNREPECNGLSNLLIDLFRERRTVQEKLFEEYGVPKLFYESECDPNHHYDGRIYSAIGAPSRKLLHRELKMLWSTG